MFNGIHTWEFTKKCTLRRWLEFGPYILFFFLREGERRGRGGILIRLHTQHRARGGARSHNP